MSESDYDQLKDKSWRRELTPAETAQLQAWLAEHPQAQADWEAEVHLTQAVRRLPDLPVPGNFTARVLQAVERKSVAVKRGKIWAWKWSLRALLPRAAAAAVIFGAALLTYHEHIVAEQRAELVQSVKIVSAMPSLPGPILQDFDTIQKMGASTGPDQELLKLMK